MLTDARSTFHDGEEGYRTRADIHPWGALNTLHSSRGEVDQEGREQLQYLGFKTARHLKTSTTKLLYACVPISESHPRVSMRLQAAMFSPASVG